LSLSPFVSLGLRVVCAITLAVVFVGAGGSPATAQTRTSVQIFATGFINPRGMTFGPDGTLYVTEAGPPGDVMVPLPVNFGGRGPVGYGGRVSRVKPGGAREDLVTGLPNVGLYGGGEMLGPTGVAILGGQLYEVGAGHITEDTMVLKVATDGGLTPIANLADFNRHHPPPGINGDAVPMGNPYDMVATAGALYITDGNFNEVLSVMPNGGISIAARFDQDPTTTGAAVGPDGLIYVGQFGNAPYPPGSGHIDKVTTDGRITPNIVTNLTTPVAVTFDRVGTMYVLQYAAKFAADKLRYVPLTGALFRVNGDGTTTPILTNLVYPTALITGPDGALYVSNFGNESTDGQGQILRVVPGDEPAQATVPSPGPDPNRSNAGSQPSSRPQPTPSGPAPAARITITEPATVTSWGYRPARVVIQVGQSVVFTNPGQIAHSATAKQGAFDTGLLKNGQSATVKFDKPGTYDYFCVPHPWMTGTIVVLASGESAPPQVVAANPSAGLTFSPPTINAALALLLVVGIIAAVYAAGFAIRRRPDDEE
jgi:plastocyanin